jgi:hypothetical protein
MPPPLRNGSVVRLLEIDPELGRRLAGERLEAARRDTIGRVRTLAPGTWSWSDYRRFDAAVLGLFVIDGVLAREVSLSNTTCTELLGHGESAPPVGRGRALCAGSLLGRLDGARADRRRRA